MSRDNSVESIARWVFVERIGELYVGIAHTKDGRGLLEITEPVSASEIHSQMRAVSGGDCYEFDCAIYAADERPNDGRTPERKLLHLISIRAEAGSASQSDGAYLISQLRDPNSIHKTTSLLWTLGYMGPSYEDVVSPFLSRANTDGEAQQAMGALFRMGLGDKYVDLFVDWMRGSAPRPHQRTGDETYGRSVYAFIRTQHPKILQALIDASNDVTEKWTTRAHARNCLASAIDLENAPIRRMAADDPYFAGVLEKAAKLLDELTSSEGEARLRGA